MKKKQVRTPRFGDYRVTRLAATPLEAAAAPQTGPSAAYRPKPAPWQTLWAERPLDLPQGRALGLRHRDATFEVAFISKATLSLRWEPFERVLTVKQALAWRARSAFSKR